MLGQVWFPIFFFPSFVATIIQYHPMMPIFKFLFLMQFFDLKIISSKQSPGSCFGSCLPSPLGQDDLKLRWRETLAPGDALLNAQVECGFFVWLRCSLETHQVDLRCSNCKGFPFLPNAMDNDGKYVLNKALFVGGGGIGPPS